MKGKDEKGTVHERGNFNTYNNNFGITDENKTEGLQKVNSYRTDRSRIMQSHEMLYYQSMNEGQRK